MKARRRSWKAAAGGAILPTYDAVFLYNAGQESTGGQQIPLIVPSNEQGAGFMAAGYAAFQRPRRRLPRDFGSGCHEYRHSGPRLLGRLGADRRDLRPGVARGDRDGCVPGSAGAVPHGRSRQAHLPRHGSDQLEATIRTAFEIARTGRPGPVVVDVPKDVQNWEGQYVGTGTLPIPVIAAA